MEQLEQHGKHAAASDPADISERADAVDGTDRAWDGAVVRAVRGVQIIDADEKILIIGLRDFSRSRTFVQVIPEFTRGDGDDSPYFLATTLPGYQSSLTRADKNRATNCTLINCANCSMSGLESI